MAWLGLEGQLKRPPINMPHAGQTLAHMCAFPQGLKPSQAPRIHPRMNSCSVLQQRCLPPQKSCKPRLPSCKAHANYSLSEGGKGSQGSKMESDREIMHLQVSSVGSQEKGGSWERL